MSMLKYWAAMRPKHTTLMAFFEWLEEEGIKVEFTRRECGSPVYDRASDLADCHLEIDRQELDRERRALLEGVTG